MLQWEGWRRQAPWREIIFSANRWWICEYPTMIRLQCSGIRIYQHWLARFLLAVCFTGGLSLRQTKIAGWQMDPLKMYVVLKIGKFNCYVGFYHRVYTPEVEHGTWKWPPGKGDPLWKLSFSGSMLNSGGIPCFFLHFFPDKKKCHAPGRSRHSLHAVSWNSRSSVCWFTSLVPWQFQFLNPVNSQHNSKAIENLWIWTGGIGIGV